VTNLEKDLQLVRKIYKDIILKYTSCKFKQENIFFKHLSEAELGESNEIYLQEYSEAVKNKLLSNKDKMDILIEKDLWSEGKEQKINDLEDIIINLNNTKSKLIIKSQIEDINKQIKEAQKELNGLRKDREDSLGLTAEIYAMRKANEYVIYSSLYKDAQLKDRYFESYDFFKEMDIEQLAEYFFVYRDYISNFNIKNLKKLVVSPFFTNMFFLSEDNIFNFYGRSLSELTQYQIDIYTIAKNYKANLIKINKSPPRDYKDLQELVDWYEGTPLVRKDTKDFYGKTYVGASKEEISSISNLNKSDVIDLHEEAKKISEGDLNFEQILKLHGEI